MIAREQVVDSGHAEVAARQVSDVLAEAGLKPTDVDVVAVGVGPGPFTSVRVGVALAHGFALAVGVPVIGVCTLDVLAADAASDGETFGVAIDARRHEIYWAHYDPRGARILGPRVGQPSTVLGRVDTPRRWCGDGLDRFPGLVADRDLVRSEPTYPRAAGLIAVALRLIEAHGGADLVGVSAAAPPARLGEHGEDGSRTEVSATEPLPPWPLYLRRPDAQPPVARGPSRILRPMRWQDVAAAVPIEHALFRAEAWSEETFWSELARAPEERTYLAVETVGEVTAYGGMAWREGEAGPECDLQTIAVAAPAQRQGLGRELLRSLLAEARRRGCSRCFLEVRGDNPGAVALYRGVGFVEIALRSRYYADGCDALIMQLDLDPGESDG